MVNVANTKARTSVVTRPILDALAVRTSAQHFIRVNKMVDDSTSAQVYSVNEVHGVDVLKIFSNGGAEMLKKFRTRHVTAVRRRMI